jgi:hypothetical protein
VWDNAAIRCPRTAFVSRAARAFASVPPAGAVSVCSLLPSDDPTRVWVVTGALEGDDAR